MKKPTDLFTRESMERICQNLAREDLEIRPDNVYHAGCRANRELIGTIASSLTLPGSEIRGSRHLAEIAHLAAEGHSSLILMEHYSNFDYPTFFRFVEDDPLLGYEVAKRLVAIQGIKLSESNDVLPYFTHSYATITICPNRELQEIQDPQEREERLKKRIPINQAATREIVRCKNEGSIILVFPSGTRYRPWDPDSKRGMREIYSYLRFFKKVVFISINGITLLPTPKDNLIEDEVVDDVVLFTVSPVVETHAFLEESQRHARDTEDKKQRVADHIMTYLERQHNDAECVRKKKIAALQRESS